jgi:predicted PurR-regulated permease PerM
VLSEGRENSRHADSSLVTATLVVAILYFAREVFIPLALAGLLAFLLAPAATRLERWGVKRTPAALLVIVLSLIGVGFLGRVVLGQIYNLAVELPQYQGNVSNKIGSLHLDSAGKLSKTIDMLGNLNRQLRGGEASKSSVVSVAPRPRTAIHGGQSLSAPTNNKAAPPVEVRVEQPSESMTEMVTNTITPFLHPLATTFLVAIFLVFMLVGRDDLQDRGLRLAGSGRLHVTTTAIVDATRRVSRYLLMQLIVNICYGAAVGAALWLIGVPHPLTWSVLTCLLRFVPYVGILMAAAGPLLLSAAASPHWGGLAWTVVTFGVLELVASNFLEPMLYGASTGISAMAILIAAVFWTLLWGLPGLLLSTPLTVCLIVIGRQVPRLHFLEVLFGDEVALPPADRFYQRMLATNSRNAMALIERELQTKSRAEVYDTILVPALSMTEEARLSDEMTSARAEEIVRSIEELAEDVASRTVALSDLGPASSQRVLCLPARSLVDEVACQLAQQALSEIASTRVMAADCSLIDLQESIDSQRPDVLCVVGVPPRAIRHTRMRAHQLRSRYPDAVIVACVLSKESDLSNLRSRIPTNDAQHVVCSLQLMKDYLLSLLHQPVVTDKEPGAIEQQIQQVDLFDGPEEGLFERIATDLARSFDAPIALITAVDGEKHFWEARCGLPEDSPSVPAADQGLSICDAVISSESMLIIEDVEQSQALAADPSLKERGIRFYAGYPLRTHHGKVIGSLCVLDTRPRQVTEQQKEALASVANAVMMAIELRGAMAAVEAPLPNSDQTNEITGAEIAGQD